MSKIKEILLILVQLWLIGFTINSISRLYDPNIYLLIVGAVVAYLWYAIYLTREGRW